MFETDDFIQSLQEQAEQEKGMETTQARDKWLRASITLFALLVAGYTTMHGISATLHYRAAGTAGMVTGIVGIIVLEGLFLVLSHGLINGTFKGSRLHVGLMALATGVALVFMLLNTVIDAQLNAGMVLSENMHFYFAYVLPISSVIAVVIAMAGLYFAPDAARARERGEAVNVYKQQQFQAYMAARKAELIVQRAIANAQLGARITAAKTVASHYQSEDVRGLIEGAAVASVPALLRQIGVRDAQQDETGDGTADLQSLADDLARQRLAYEQPPQTEQTRPQPQPHANGQPTNGGGRIPPFE